jgi:hypothetical protein
MVKIGWCMNTKDTLQIQKIPCKYKRYLANTKDTLKIKKTPCKYKRHLANTKDTLQIYLDENKINSLRAIETAYSKWKWRFKKKRGTDKAENRIKTDIISQETQHGIILTQTVQKIGDTFRRKIVNITHFNIIK